MKPRTIFLATIVAPLLLAIVALGIFRIAAQVRETNALTVLPDVSGRAVPTSEGSIFVIERGSSAGTPLLFAHGTAAWSGLWLPTLDHMAAQGFHAIAYDLPPFGFSHPAADGDYSRPRQADRIIALVQALDTRPIAIGHSVGAGPLAEAVMKRPDLFDGFVVVDGAISLNSHLAPKTTPIWLRPTGLRRFLTSATLSNPLLTRLFLRNFISVKDAATPYVVQTLKVPLSRKGYTAAAADWLPQLFATPLDAHSTRPGNWQALPLPLALIWGETDTITPLSQGQDLQAANQSASLTVLPDVGHIPQIEAPEVFWQALLDVLRQMTQET
ncbi:Lipase 3 precursor [Shimia sp. SK013]|nr:Lipase 3 precursor [Shimia sp. SK013]